MRIKFLIGEIYIPHSVVFPVTIKINKSINLNYLFMQLFIHILLLDNFSNHNFE